MQKSIGTTQLELLAASQWGMFTTAQAQALGIRRNQVSRMASALRIEPICYGVYRFTAGAQPTQAGLKAEWLSVFPKQTAAKRLSSKPLDAVLAGRSAAYALGAGDFHASPYTFIVPQRRQTSRTDIRFLQCKLDENDIVFCDGIPTTSFERTVYDLLRLDEDPDLVDKFIQDAARKQNHAFNIERLGSLLSPIASRYGFPARDGNAFAADLVARNAASIQIKKGIDSIEQALAALTKQKARGSAGRSANLPIAVENKQALGHIATPKTNEHADFAATLLELSRAASNASLNQAKLGQA